ncbi:MAG: LysM peptidoglycan-binding domain-containing protein [Hyphomicrobium sp.]
MFSRTPLHQSGRPVFLAFALFAIPFALGACSSGRTAYYDQNNFTTASLPPRPSEPLVQSAPQPYGHSYGVGSGQSSGGAYSNGTSYVPPRPTPYNSPYGQPYGGQSNSQYNSQYGGGQTYGQPYGQQRPGIPPNAVPGQANGQYRWNGNPTRVVEGTPPPQPAPPAPTVTASGQRLITVRPGDTLFSLSRQYGVSLGDLTASNRLTTASIRSGQTLVLPPAR